MKITIRAIGIDPQMRPWPDGWPLPRIGELIYYKEEGGVACEVTSVNWYPEGDDNGDPHIYVVANTGPRWHA